MAAATVSRIARQAAREAAAHVAGKIPLPPSPTAGNGEGTTFDFASMVRLTDYYAVSPLALFQNINSTFAASHVTRSLN